MNRAEKHICKVCGKEFATSSATAEKCPECKYGKKFAFLKKEKPQTVQCKDKVCQYYSNHYAQKCSLLTTAYEGKCPFRKEQ